jgi:hypothetical protein
MKHYDYDWDLYPHMIKLDEELNVDALGWKDGDIFKFETVDGMRVIKKVDPVEKFVRGFGNE